MRIGIFSGSFDPPTKGHEWIIQESYQSYDKFFVVIGHHPLKEFKYTPEQRLAMLEAFVPAGVFVDFVGERSFRAYLKRLYNRHPAAEFTLVRGIRNAEDFEYEEQISTSYHEQPVIDGMKQVWLIPPPSLAGVSSSLVKSTNAAELLPDSLRFRDGCSTVFYKACPKIAKARTYFETCVNAGIFKLADTISGDQVRKTLDPYPIDVVTSDVFVLSQVAIKDIHVFDDRYQPHSTSVGPIMVDYGQYAGIDGPMLIEGKHRLLDARERGEQTILAYVGDRALRMLVPNIKGDNSLG